MNIFRTFTTVSDGITVFEALAVFSVVLVLAGYLSKASEKPTAKKISPL